MITAAEVAELVQCLRNPMMALHKAEVGEGGSDYPVLVEDEAIENMKAAANMIEQLWAELELQ